jgi:hypothetical protein
VPTTSSKSNGSKRQKLSNTTGGDDGSRDGSRDGSAPHDVKWLDELAFGVTHFLPTGSDSTVRR